MAVRGLLLFILTHLVYLIKISELTIFVTLFLFGLEAPLIMAIPYLLLIESVLPQYRDLASFSLNFCANLSFVLTMLYQFGRSWWIVS